MPELRGARRHGNDPYGLDIPANLHQVHHAPGARWLADRHAPRHDHRSVVAARIRFAVELLKFEEHFVRCVKLKRSHGRRALAGR